MRDPCGSERPSMNLRVALGEGVQGGRDRSSAARGRSAGPDPKQVFGVAVCSTATQYVPVVHVGPTEVAPDIVDPRSTDARRNRFAVFVRPATHG